MNRGKLKIDAVILCFFLLFSLPLFARENTDVIIMKNGDHLTGQIKGLDNGVCSMWVYPTSSRLFPSIGRR